jgi:hypothetical protein
VATFEDRVREIVNEYVKSAIRVYVTDDVHEHEVQENCCRYVRQALSLEYLRGLL